MNKQRVGFTLIEVMVSILIFSVMSIAMIGVFSAATSIFRAGESARAASDEATAVLAMIDDDLKRMVAPQDGGFFYTKAFMPNTSEPGGNMVLAFKIRNPDAGAVTENGFNARLIVVYWVDKSTDQPGGVANWDLHRATGQAADSDADPNTLLEYPVMSGLFGAADSVVARGCLFFGVDLSTPEFPRASVDWLSCLPNGTNRYCTEVVSGAPAELYPDAIRLSLSITGGNRFGSTGRVISDDGTGIRVSGVRQVSITGEAMARIDDPESDTTEWVGFNSFTKGKLSFDGGDVKRGLRRTTTSSHATGTPVYFCPTFTLVRSLPR